MDIYNVANMLKLQHKTIHDIELRVTYYARVSTTREEQEGSIEVINYIKKGYTIV